VGETGVEAIDMENVKTGEKTQIPVRGVFIFVGYSPNSELAKGVLELDEYGYVLSNNDMETSIPGVFAVGDIRSKALRQVSTAVGEGATAAFMAEKFVENAYRG